MNGVLLLIAETIFICVLGLWAYFIVINVIDKVFFIKK